MAGKIEFTTLGRQRFREYFQPSRILLGVIPAPTKSGVDIITLSFNMYCSYKPVMMAVAIQNISSSFRLIQEAREYVLAVPGESLANETLFCGVTSISEVDKVQELGLELYPSEKISVPGLTRAIANIEMIKEVSMEVGDHILVVGRVVRFGVNRYSRELPLLSVGPNTSGFRVLARKGIHRIGTVVTQGSRPGGIERK
jgi:flavin reductase (DIM6/NTAB) family NADH-FMN oxidoreductase RutF